MKIYSIPKDLKAIIFDIDGTLYTNSFYVYEQVDVQVRHFAKVRGITESQARSMIQDYRRQWSAEHGGKKISLGNAFTAFGVSIETSVAWRNELLEPSRFLQEDAPLKTAIEKLGARYRLICLTNNPVEAARKTLEAVGIDKLLPEIIGLDTFYLSKPNRRLLEEAAKRCGCNAENCLCVGDRYDIDLALGIEMGMGGILVDGAEDVCKMADVLDL